MYFTKVFLFNSFYLLNRALREPIFNPPKTKTLSCICGEKIALGHYEFKSDGKTHHTIRIWYANTYFGLWHDSFDSGKFLAALDYIICDNHIKIDYLSIYDAEYIRNNIYYRDNAHLSNRRSMELSYALLEYVTNIARAQKKQKIIVDVHRNLRIFDRYYRPFGFSATERRCLDNKYWVEAEFFVEPATPTTTPDLTPTLSLISPDTI